MTGGGVVGAEVADRSGSNWRSSQHLDLVGVNAVGGVDAFSGLAESDNPPKLIAGTSLAGYAKAGVGECVAELRSVRGYADRKEASHAMLATLSALGDGQSSGARTGYLKSAAENLPAHIGPEGVHMHSRGRYDHRKSGG